MCARLGPVAARQARALRRNLLDKGRSGPSARVPDVADVEDVREADTFQAEWRLRWRAGRSHTSVDCRGSTQDLSS